MSKDSEKRPLIIIGAGGHSVSVANVAISAGYKIRCFIDSSKFGSNIFGYDILKDITEIRNLEEFSFSIAIGDNFRRECAYRDLLSVSEELKFPILAHSTAVISPLSTIEEGSVLMPNSIVGPNSTIGSFTILNTQASLDHDCEMKKFSSLAPAAVTGGNVTVGERTAIGIGAIIKHGIQIGDDSVIGAASFVNKNIGDNLVCYGMPAHTSKRRNRGEPYL